MKTKQSACRVRIDTPAEAREVRETIDSIIPSRDRDEDEEAYSCFKEFIVSTQVWGTDQYIKDAWAYFLAGYAYSPEEEECDG